MITAASSRPIRSVKPALPPTSKGTKEKKAKKAKTGATKAENAGSVDLAASSPMINDASAERLQSEVSVLIPPPREDTDDETEDGPAYWLMKAEPESRIEKGKDVKFSIDDLKNALVPEAWDGKQYVPGCKYQTNFIYRCSESSRFEHALYMQVLSMLNITARNNMRAMIKGDLAFFYHSNCKVPGIVGIMEVVQEHSVDGVLIKM